MDGISYTDLFTADINVHQGWNYFNWKDPATKPKYAYYRFFSSAAKGCKINEIKFKGTETIDDSSPTLSCPVKLFFGD